ncbi:MAG TPA: ankyrin repeat domain-containing protein, partial [Myxococcota bacterium]|nr:ankyrin repeat domain-containing protein [Myxococcota bacterium]
PDQELEMGLVRNDEIRKDHITFSLDDFSDADMLNKAIAREIQSRSSNVDKQEHASYVNSYVPNALQDALANHHKTLSLIVDSVGNTALHLAAWDGRIDIVEVLLNFPDRIEVQNLLNAETMYGNSPLHCAAIEGQIGIIRLLLLRSDTPHILLTKLTKTRLLDGESAKDGAIFGCKYRTWHYLETAEKIYKRRGAKALKASLMNYTPQISQEASCTFCACIVL